MLRPPQVDLAGPGRRASSKLTVSFPIEVLPHPKYRRQGSDVYATLELPLTDALLGTTVGAARWGLGGRLGCVPFRAVAPCAAHEPGGPLSRAAPAAALPPRPA